MPAGPHGCPTSSPPRIARPAAARPTAATCARLLATEPDAARRERWERFSLACPSRIDLPSEPDGLTEDEAFSLLADLGLVAGNPPRPVANPEPVELVLTLDHDEVRELEQVRAARFDGPQAATPVDALPSLDRSFGAASGATIRARAARARSSSAATGPERRRACSRRASSSSAAATWTSSALRRAGRARATWRARARAGVLTRAFCDREGCELPIVQAPLGSAAAVELVGAVCEAGGLGMLAGPGSSPTSSSLRSLACAPRTARPFGVNLVLHWDQASASQSASTAASRC